MSAASQASPSTCSPDASNMRPNGRPRPAVATPAVPAGRPLTESERELRADIKMAADRGDWDWPE